MRDVRSPACIAEVIRVCGGCVALLLSTMGLMELPAGRPLLALSGHATRADECLLLGAKRTLTNRCLPISIYEYTAIS